jgi:hypothetical protein
MGETWGPSEVAKVPQLYVDSPAHDMLLASPTIMIGTVRGRHLLTHGPLIVRLFGLRAYLRCVVGSLRSTKNCPLTFLSTVMEPMNISTRKLATLAPSKFN